MTLRIGDLNRQLCLILSHSQFCIEGEEGCHCPPLLCLILSHGQFALKGRRGATAPLPFKLPLPPLSGLAHAGPERPQGPPANNHACGPEVHRAWQGDVDGPCSLHC